MMVHQLTNEWLNIISNQLINNQNPISLYAQNIETPRRMETDDFEFTSDLQTFNNTTCKWLA